VNAFRIEVRVMPRTGLLDPQGQAVEHALRALGFAGVDEMRIGKHLVFRLEAPSPDEAAARARTMCDRLLANPVTEDYHVHVEAV
jgi:phosphoribosylformylglycinamidine synthase